MAQAGVPVIPIIETATGLLSLAEIAYTPGVERLVFGSLDYGLDLHLRPDTPGAELVLDHSRVQILLHTRAAGLTAALDGVFLGIQNHDGLRHAMGFGGMLCIHPTQVPLIHEAFAPDTADLEWAKRVVKMHHETGMGAFMLDSGMVDAPVIALARHLLASVIND